MKIERHETGSRMSKAVIHGDTVYLAGIVADSPKDKSVAEQTRSILSQIAQTPSAPLPEHQSGFNAETILPANTPVIATPSQLEASRPSFAGSGLDHDTDGEKTTERLRPARGMGRRQPDLGHPVQIGPFLQYKGDGRLLG